MNFSKDHYNASFFSISPEKLKKKPILTTWYALMTFRKDINGLRAIAVAAVVLFHFNPSWVPGGFAGVDVFFVISGFLMTGIIFRGLEQNNFSILNFYVARANRIIPALSILCSVLLVIGWFCLTPNEYVSLGKHVASSVGFFSNFTYWTESGYFDAASHEKWLLHTWSLSVEWQFYIIYPILLVILSKFLPLRRLKPILLISTMIGFVFCAFATYKWPDPSYYLLPARAWEMMLGGVAYLYPLSIKKNRKRLVEWLGLLLIIASYFLISDDNPWPGYLAIFPVIGSYLILQAQRSNSFITGNIVSQKIGSWSYSIYLWHWPIVVAIYLFALDPIYSYLGILLSVALGFLSYKYIEKIKFSNSFPNLISYLKCKPLYFASIVALMGTAVQSFSNDLTSLRLSSEAILIQKQQNRDPREPKCGLVINGVSPKCMYGSGPVKAIVIGDSHSQAQNIAIGKRAEMYGGSILSLGLSGCPTIENVYKKDPNKLSANYNCGKLVSNAVTLAKEKYPNIPVIIINRTSQYLHGLNESKSKSNSRPNTFVDITFDERNEAYQNNITGHMVDTACAFSKNNPVYMVRPTPELKENVPLRMFRHITVTGNLSTIQITKDEFLNRQKLAYEMQDEAKRKCGVKILDPIPYLCDENYCYGDSKGIPLYFDDDHLSIFGSKLISPIYDEVFKEH
ncbi:acyltransferase family protein [Acinetobacter johnsonii]|uniref:acyltransferase family protein n=1 Tax=Acinetobacter johnsonii TaxID=40214 RepID=UPI001D19750A|nr:acyltransferase family protein [Acinetobacter johnsonii]